MEEQTDTTGNFLLYRGDEGNIHVQVILNDETVWTTQKGMAEIFGVVKSTVSEHLSNIFESGELPKDPTVRKIRTVQNEGGREVKRDIEFYNLDAIISVGYRVNSYQATQFRIWATGVLKEYMVKGFAMDDERLKHGQQLFGKDYFDELVERVREIRASERRFYQKITDIYATSVDYDPKAPLTRDFFATVQNKLHYAVTHKTAAEIVYTRADSTKPNMGLTSWKNAPEGKILRSDTSIAKNYLTEDEIRELELVVNMYLDYAELQAKKQTPMTMKDWVAKLDAFLQFNEYDILNNTGQISASVAQALAGDEFRKFRVIQDKSYRSDFDKFIEQVKSSKKDKKQ